MHLDIRSRGFALSSPLREHAERRLGFALARYSPQLGSVIMRLEDINGPKGGEDKRCRIEVRFEGHPALLTEATGEDLYRAIDTAADRLGRAIARALA